MNKILFILAVCVVATPSYAQWNNRGSSGVTNSARIEQSAGAFAFAQVAQGDRATIESPRNDPLVTIESGAFVMPYINGSFNASRGGSVRAYDPIGSYIED